MSAKESCGIYHVQEPSRVACLASRGLIRITVYACKRRRMEVCVDENEKKKGKMK